jgi:hypothetical protein
MIDARGVTTTGRIEYSAEYEGDDAFRLTLISAGGHWAASGNDLFEALCNLRLELEKAGVRLCVAGARTDVYPSGVAREMGLGQVAYILSRHRFIWRMPILREYGRRLKRVDIFFFNTMQPCRERQ